MPRKSTKSTKRTTATKPDNTTERAKPPRSPKPTKRTTPRRQTAEVIAVILYFGVFGVHDKAISELILSKYPRTAYVNAKACHNRFLWFRDTYLHSRGLPLNKGIVGIEVKNLVPDLEIVNNITEINEECEKIIQKASFGFRGALAACSDRR